MKVAAFQAPLLPSGSIEAIGLIADQVKACEAAGVEILCCPEAVLGGLADYSRRPADCAIDVARGQLRAVLTPLASRTVTTIVGFTEVGPGGQLFNSRQSFARVKLSACIGRCTRPSIGPCTSPRRPRRSSKSDACLRHRDLPGLDLP